MFCKKCGNQLDEGALFCSKCGTNQSEELKTQSEVTESSTQNDKPKSKKSSGLVGIVIVALIAVIVVGYCIITNIKTKVDLNEYVTVTFDGYDSIGTATVVFDVEEFLDDYENKLKIGKNFKNTEEYRIAKALGLNIKDSDAAEILYDTCISFSLDNTSGLSNGDVVTLTWDCNDDSAEAYFRSKLVYSDIEFEVTGLMEAEKVNPFDDISISYSGCAPIGSVEVEYTGNIPGISFAVDNSGSLSNGDVVAVKVLYNNSDASEDSVINEGILLEELSMDITVDGLMTYVTDLSQIPDETMEAMTRQSCNILESYAATYWDSCWSVSSQDLVGVYFLTKKDMTTGSDKNIITLVFDVYADFDYTTTTFKDYSYVGGASFLYPVTFSDIVILPDGTVSVDTSDYTTPSNLVTREYSGLINVFAPYWWFRGYDDYESLFSDYVTTKILDYDYVSTVEEDEYEIVLWWEFAD